MREKEKKKRAGKQAPDDVAEKEMNKGPYGWNEEREKKMASGEERFKG